MLLTFPRYQKLIDCKNEHGETALQIALKEKMFSRIEILLDHGAGKSLCGSELSKKGTTSQQKRN